MSAMRTRQSGERVVLITGCSSGFGAECVRLFSDSGDQVIATLRDPTHQPFSNPTGIQVRELDVTDEESIDRCITEVLKTHGRIDVLVNNAGIHLLGAMEDMNPDQFRQVFETNFFGAINLTRAVLPTMREQKNGKIITVSSVGSMVGRVIDGAYCASKAALETAFEAMRHEVKRFGIDVSVVCPSAFRTDIGRKMRLPNDGQLSPYRELLEFRYDRVCDAVEQGDDPARVAELILKISLEQNPDFRYLIGNKAGEIVRMLSGIDDSERQELIRRLADIEWWTRGSSTPVDAASSPDQEGPPPNGD